RPAPPRESSGCRFSSSRVLPGHFADGYAKRYWPEPTSTATTVPSCFGAERPLPAARGLPPSVTEASCAPGRRTVARVLAGISTASSNAASLSVQAELTLPYGVWWLAVTLVNPPPGRGWIRMCL